MKRAIAATLDYIFCLKPHGEFLQFGIQTEIDRALIISISEGHYTRGESFLHLKIVNILIIVNELEVL